MLCCVGACGRPAVQPPKSPVEQTAAAPALPAEGCANPDRDGVIGSNPSFKHADRDLNGDDIDEVVVADRSMCTEEGNCHWNIFRQEHGCHHYLGTVAAASLQRLASRGDDGIFGLRTWWRLTGGRRLLMQEYHFRRGAYRIADVLLCRQQDDDRILCNEVGEGHVP